MIVFSFFFLFICTLMVRLSFWWSVSPALRFVFLSLFYVSMNSQPWLLLACCFSLLLLASCFGLCFVWTVLLFMSWLYASTCKLSTLFSDYFYFSSIFIVYYDIFRQLRDNLQIMVMEQRMCLGTFSQPARSFTTYFLFARVRILPEAFCRIGKQFPIR